MTKYVVWSYDQDQMVHQTKKVCRTIDNLSVLGGLEGAVIPVLGYYEGQYEQSFLSTEADFWKIFAAGHLTNQKSVLYITDGHKGKQYASEVYLKQPETTSLGTLKSSRKRPDTEAWTYRYDTKLYYYTE
jgi:hypothetical protein